MSTRSIVAAPSRNNPEWIKGVYVHSDGYPEGRIPVLQELISRDGIDRVIEEITGLPNGWSCLDPDQKGDMHSIYTMETSRGRFAPVPGYGIQYVNSQANTKYWIPRHHASGDVFIEYIYVLKPDGTITWAPSCNIPYKDLQWNVYNSKTKKGPASIEDVKRAASRAKSEEVTFQVLEVVIQKIVNHGTYRGKVIYEIVTAPGHKDYRVAVNSPAEKKVRPTPDGYPPFRAHIMINNRGTVHDLMTHPSVNARRK